MDQSIAIQFNALTKSFGSGSSRVRAVNNLQLQIAAGQVYGFLGLNGAGKTTTIRMLMDLIRPTQGSILIFGRDVRDPVTLRRTGALVEGPAFYAYLSGRENLKVLADVRQVKDPSRIDALLSQVNLADVAQRRAGRYSTGMKQRLGLASALLHDPDLVILDEPTNGLDPAGMQAMRRFIRTLATEQGKTVFLSSHLLNEVEQICDRVAIVHRGEIVREGTVPDLLSAPGHLRLEAKPLERAEALLRGQWRVQRAGAKALYIAAKYDETPLINQKLVEAGVAVYHLAVERQSLEAYFMSVTGREPAGA